MKKTLILLTLLTVNFCTLSQTIKRVLDTSDVRGFFTLTHSHYSISDDGKYMAFDNPRSLINYRGGQTIKSTDNKWEKVIDDDLEGDLTFTSDSKRAIFLTKGKRLVILQLGKEGSENITGVDGYKLLRYSVNKDYLMIDRRGDRAGVIMKDLSTGNEYNYGSPEQYIFSSESSALVVKDTTGRDSGYSVYHLKNGGKARKIWSDTGRITQLISSTSGNQIAFCTESDIYYFENGKSELAVKIEIPRDNEFTGLKLLGQLWFSPSEHLLLFRMEQPLAPIDPSVNPVSIFSYLDGAFDLNDPREPLVFDCLYDTRTRKVIRICHEDEKLESVSADDNSLLVYSVSGREDEYMWNPKARHKDFVLSLKSGDKVAVKTQRRNNMMSPSGMFVVGQNEQDGDIFGLDVRNNVTHNLTGHLPIPLDGVPGDGAFGATSRSLYWDRKIIDDKLIIYDQYDVWMVNLNEPDAAICLTNGYGRRHHIIFRVTEGTGSYSSGQDIILSAFNDDNKDAGYYKVNVGPVRDPELLCMGRYQYSRLRKCGPLNRWILKRNSATEAPNYFWTEDFRDFHAMSDIHPEKSYYWYNTELVNYVTKDGVKSQAIIYKPENFDPQKKYPVLFTFYEKETRKLNEYISPAFTEQFSFNIPMMLSRGYIVCVPDIHFKIGETAHCFVDCVEGAADYLSRLPFIDSLHYGACGGSFGGYGVNCLAAFSHRFSAVVPISGLSDFVSGYGNVPGLLVDIYETGQCRMGVSLSTDPMRYLRNSPVAYAKHVTTPVLIVNTLCDYNVNVQQGIEWFISLRREGKQSWMLRYKGAEVSHGIYVLNDQIDLNIRMNQFFDHYLKGSPAPVWMTEEIKKQDEGVRSGYEYNPQLLKPPAGLLRDSL